jgi:hypothetical protein
MLGQGLARSGNEYGPLTDLPDWSYVDQRAAPVLTKKQRHRVFKMEQTRNRIDMLVGELADVEKRRPKHYQRASTFPVSATAQTAQNNKELSAH